MRTIAQAYAQVVYIKPQTVMTRSGCTQTYLALACSAIILSAFARAIWSACNSDFEHGNRQARKQRMDKIREVPSNIARPARSAERAHHRALWHTLSLKRCNTAVRSLGAWQRDT